MNNPTNHIIQTLLGFICLYLCTFQVYGQSIQFQSDPWEEILAQAEHTNKIIFVDVYTTWCGPCKKMDQQVFSKKKVGDFFNQHFINFKIDADQEAGRIFKEQYNVVGYPSFLFIRADGNPMWKEIGFVEEEALLSLGEEIQKLKSNPELSEMTTRYNQGELEPAFLVRFMELRKERLKADNSKILAQFIQQSDSIELNAAPHLTVITDHFSKANTPAFDLVLKHKEKITNEELLSLAPSYLEAISKQEQQIKQMPANQGFNASPDLLRKAIIKQCLEERIDNALNNSFAEATEQKDNEHFQLILDKYLQFNAQVKRRNIQQRSDQIKVKYYKQTEQDSLYALSAESYINKYILSEPLNFAANTDSLKQRTEEMYLQDQKLSKVLGQEETKNLQHLQSQKRKLSKRNDARHLIQTAKDYYDLFDEELKLAQAIAYVEHAIQLYEEPLHYLTYAKLINKLGDQSLAIRLIEKGLQLTGFENEDQVKVSSSTRKREFKQLSRYKEKLLEGE